MSSIREALDTLQQFDQRVERIRTSRTGIRLFAGSIDYHLGAVPRGPDESAMFIDSDGPDQESWDAFALNLRYFIQDNERISIRNMAKLYDTLPVSKDVRKAFADARADLNSFLDSSTWFHLSGVESFYRDVLGAYMYGDLAHMNPAKRNTLQEWHSGPITSMFSQMLFNSTLRGILKRLVAICPINEQASIELRSLQPNEDD